MDQIAITITDAERRILWVNHDFEAITGYTLDEAFGRVPEHLLQGPNTEPDAVERIRQGLQREKPFKDAITNYRKNGETYLCKLVVHPIHDYHNNLVNFLAFEVDGDVVRNVERIPLMNAKTRYHTSSLQGLGEIRLYDRMKKAMEQDELYLDPELTLRKLSIKLNTNTKYLSQVINHHGGCNFLSFINAYRIDKFKEQLEAGEFYKHTFFGIAQRCGFKNKSTFYKAFRDTTGVTPKAYVEKLKKFGGRLK